MTKDYSRFLPQTSKPPTEPQQTSPLQALGWQPFFAQQTGLDEISQSPPARVVAVHRNGLQVRGEHIEEMIPPGLDATVGDWLLFDAARPAQSRVLRRKSLFKRRAPGTDRRVQLIAANVDTALIVSSCNQDFNIARLERYMALCFEAEVTPVIVLTKADLCDDPHPNVDQAQSISDNAEVLAVDARSGEAAETLEPWCKTGQTLAVLGSSGVGKSTLVNALMGAETAATRAIREDDSKGRHTTTHRQLHMLGCGACILDTPGMRELQLTDAETGLATVFGDIDDLATQCRFSDCSHQSEPGCAVKGALDEGALDPDRIRRWRKLVAEEQFNAASLAERRAKDRAFGKLVRTVMKNKPR